MLRILVAFIYGLTLFTPAASLNTSNPCITSQQLVNGANIAEVQLDQTCSPLGRVFLMGQGGFKSDGKTELDMDEEFRALDRKHRYYFLSRMYLAKKAQGIESLAADLILMNASIPQTGLNPDASRHRFYRNFFTMEIFRQDEHYIDDFQAAVLVASLAYPNPEYSLDVRDATICFVENDIPDLDEAEIQKSSRFEHCIERKKSQRN